MIEAEKKVLADYSEDEQRALIRLSRALMTKVGSSRPWVVEKDGKETKAILPRGVQQSIRTKAIASFFFELHGTPAEDSARVLLTKHLGSPSTRLCF